MKKIFLILIILLAFVLRFWKLDSYPALNADEASNSYDAYSLIQTGMDQHGHAWPITFQSFNDYKPGLYVYIDIPLVKLFGLNEWSARVPGALFGVLSILMIYLFVKELFDDEKFALVSALFLAISPWHIQFSRGGWEANTATFFVLAGLVFFIRSLNQSVGRQKLLNLVLSSVFLVASLYIYHAVRVVVPLLGLSILIIYRKTIVKNFKPYLIFGIVSGALLIPLLLDLLSPGALSRVAGVGLFADPGPVNRINEQRGDYADPGDKIGIFLHNKIVNYGLAFMNNWSSHFSGEFLFMTGDAIQRNDVPETGEMYLFDIVFIVVGLITIIRTFRGRPKQYLLIISWLLLAPVPSALTFQAPNALRAHNMVIPITIISALGLASILNRIGSMKIKWLSIVGFLMVGLFIFWNLARYEHMYWVHMAKEYPYSSQYGVKELVSYLSQNQPKNKDIYITNRYDQPYILFLFYQKYPPQKFQFSHTLTSRDDFGFSTVSDFDKYHFGPIDFSSMQSNFPGSLIIGTPGEIPQSANIVKRIYGTNGFEYFDVVSN